MVARYTLADHEVIVDYSDSDDIKINGKSIHYYYDCPECKDKPITLLVKDCEKFSAHVIEKYWYFLDQAKVVYSSIAKTKTRAYCFVTYVNLLGTFFAIGSHCDEDTPVNKVNTFVRLGNGFEDGSEATYNPVPFDTIRLPLQSYSQ